MTKKAGRSLGLDAPTGVATANVLKFTPRENHSVFSGGNELVLAANYAAISRAGILTVNFNTFAVATPGSGQGSAHFAKVR